MADNVTIKDGAGANSVIASDEIGGVNYQRVKIALGSDGTAVDASATNPIPTAEVGELLEAIEALRFAVGALTRTIGMALPNAQGFPVMEARQATAANLNATVSGTVTSNIGSGTLAALTTLTNQTQMGGWASNYQIPALMHMQADGLRANISVT